MKLIKNYEKEPEQFDSSMLEVGQMMEVSYGPYINHILLRRYGEIISLTNLNCIWDKDVKLPGELLKSGESITLVQE